MSDLTTLESLRWQRKRNQEIERQLKAHKSHLDKRQMILLLGTGESGKSTFLKQMRIINGKRFSPQELERFKNIIYDNIYRGVLSLIQARANFDLPWTNGQESAAALAAQELEQHFATYRTIHRERMRLNQSKWTEEEFLALAPAFQSVWNDGSIRATFDQRSRIITDNFSDNVRYYLTRLSHIAIKNYTPTDADIVWSREPTESIIEEEFKVHQASLLFVDVGGQTKERRKWCHCFSDMTAVLFLVASSHYDERYQDRVTQEFRHKLHEAMVVFEGLINHVAFADVSIVMFFNKTDILQEKLKSRRTNICDFFPNFPSDSDPFELRDVQKFLVDAFASLIDSNIRSSESTAQSGYENLPNLSTRKQSNAVRRRSSKRALYKHFTTAVEPSNIETVFYAMQDIILRHTMRRVMMN